jgi:hypothetical protein
MGSSRSRARLLSAAGVAAGIAVGVAAGMVAGCGATRGVADDVAPRAAAGMAAIDRVLAPQVTPAFQSEVLVLGTSHLDRYGERLRAEHLERLLALLEAFAPTRIAVESLTADEVALLGEREAHDPAAARVLNMFARGALNTGRAMQEALGIDRVAAELRAGALGGRAGLTPAERLELVGLQLAAYELNSATLQWSYLPEPVRSGAGPLPPQIRDLLNRRLLSANEIVTLALPLARRLGLQQLHSMDSQYDGVRILSAPADELTALLTDPARGELQDGRGRAHADSIREHAFAAGDLLPLYLYGNSDAYHTVDVAQWNWLFQGRHAGGLDRLRYALWELRNLRQAMHILDVAGSTRPERVLVIVGSAHKPYLDRVLATQLSVRLVHLADLVTPGAPAAAAP